MATRRADATAGRASSVRPYTASACSPGAACGVPYHSSYSAVSASRKSADRSTTLMWVGRAARVACVVAWGRQQKAASMDAQSTSAILDRVAAGEPAGRAPARWGKTSPKGLPALDSPVRAAMTRPGWLATRRTASAPV